MSFALLRVLAYAVLLLAILCVAVFGYIGYLEQKEEQSSD